MGLDSAGTRAARRKAYAKERKANRSASWGTWERIDLPTGIPGGRGWCASVRCAYRNELYAVLVRMVAARDGETIHCAIRTASNLEPPWRDKQRIKNELFGEDRVAVEVMPSQANLIDEADMYHMWVLPVGASLPFGLKNEERAA